MSLATWKKEFYPVKPTKKMSAIEAVKHSLQKWEGLKSKNLNKHELEVSPWNSRIEEVYSAESLAVDITTCALCVKFYDHKNDENPCHKCPLYLSREGNACDSYGEYEVEHPYGSWVEYNNPLPMIRDLKKTLKMLEREALAK